MNMDKKIKEYLNSADRQIKAQILSSIPVDQQIDFVEKTIERSMVYDVHHTQNAKNEQQIQSTIEDGLDKIKHITLNAIQTTNDNRIVKTINYFLSLFLKVIPLILRNRLRGATRSTFEVIAVVTFEILIGVIKATLNYFVSSLANKEFWQTVTELTVKEWDENKEKGLLTQIWCASKKVVAAFSYSFIVCLNNALEDHDVKLDELEKKKIEDSLLNSLSISPEIQAINSE